MKPKKVVYYDDLLNDDFAQNKIKRKPLPENYKYVSMNPILWFITFLLYWVVALPILWLVGKIGYGVKVLGKKNLRKVRHQGVFYYGNHTQIADAWLAQCYMSGFRRTFIVASQDATSIKGIRWLIKGLGCIPVPENPKQREGFVAAIRHHIKFHHGICIYPEAHIWPYATRIRPFVDASFTYPAELDAPVIPFCVTYRSRKIFKNASPRMTIHIGKPIYPDMNLSLPERKKALRDACYEYMIDKATEDDNAEYISYLPRKKQMKE